MTDNADSNSEKYPYTLTRVWGGSLNEEGLRGGENAVEKGVTSTHVANTLYTTNKESYDKAEAAGIPCAVFTDKKGITVYEIHFSFGPNNTPIGAMLDPSYLVNCLNAQLLTPAHNNTPIITTDLIKTNNVNSNLDILKLFTTKIKLYPLFVLNDNDQARTIYIENKLSIDAFTISINKSLDKYLHDKEDSESRELYFNEVNAAFIDLKKSMDPEDTMTQNQFLHYFNENIGTVGLPPAITEKTPLISMEESKAGKKGFVEEDYIKEMVRIKNAIDGNGKLGFIGKALFSYNFILYNCSHAVRSLYLSSANDARISAKLEHTIGWNDIEKNGVFSIKNVLALPLLVFARLIESPVNFAYNLRKANLKREELNNAVANDIQSENNRSSLFHAPTAVQQLLKSRLSVISSLKLSFYRRPHTQPILKDLAGGYGYGIAVATTKEGEHTNYVVSDRKTQVFSGSYDEQSGLVKMQLPLPLDPDKSADLLAKIKEAFPNTTKFEITAGKAALVDAEKLKELIKNIFKVQDADVKVKPESDKPSVQRLSMHKK